ncbi:MAG TPA: PQQ-binding-like beta-propeller repeat protein, partial [Pirellulales bacterium]|nr:PQQ-binding-like beta-propeller repeat protein [Pirellulales bacterium]
MPRISASSLALLVVMTAALAQADEWPQWRGPTRDGVWSETGLVDHFASTQLPLKWRAPIGSGYTGPTVCDGRVFLTDRLVEPKQMERVLAFDRETGKPLWTYEYECPYSIGYPAGPRAAVLVDEGRAFALGATGRLHVLDAASGSVLWENDLEKTYDIRMPIWGISSSPLVYGDLLVVQIGGNEGACLVAFDKKNGEERWRALDDDASYAAPIIVEQNGQNVLVCLTGQHVAGLKPDTGEVLWKYPFPPAKMVIGIATPV